jgi:methyl-accepting chemotaxis protein
MAADKPITKEAMEIYVNILEKQVSQMTLFVHTLEEMHEEIREINKRLSNGLKGEIIDHVTEQASNINDKLEKSLTTTYMIKDSVDRSTEVDKGINDRAHSERGEVMDKMSVLKEDINELRSSIKIDRATNLIGLGTFVIGILTIILKVFGKL